MVTMKKYEESTFHMLPVSPEQADNFLSTPSSLLIESLAAHEGDCMILGAGGKMGLHLSSMLARGLRKAGNPANVTAVSRFRSVHALESFHACGIETIACDLESQEELAGLPDAPNIIYMAGAKFGTSGEKDLLQRTNVELPTNVRQRFPGSRFIVFSTGCVYSMVSPASGGSRECDETNPPGDYAKSCLCREAAFIETAESHGPSSIIRLNYATEFRYGVLVDIARNVMNGQPIDLTTGFVNVIWQRDAVDQILRTLPLASAPPLIINITGPDVLRVKDLATAFGRIFGIAPQFTGEEAPTAWLNNASFSHERLGMPSTGLATMIDWTAAWMLHVGQTFGKPTGFERRDGNF